MGTFILLIWIVYFTVAALLGYGLPKRKKPHGFEQQRIDRAKQDALDDIRRRRERAEDQLRRMSRWSR